MHAIIQMTLNRPKQGFLRGVTKSKAKYENLIDNACENTGDVQQN